MSKRGYQPDLHRPWFMSQPQPQSSSQLSFTPIGLVSIVSPSTSIATDSWCAANLARLLAPRCTPCPSAFVEAAELVVPMFSSYSTPLNQDLAYGTWISQGSTYHFGDCRSGVLCASSQSEMYMTAETPRLVAVSVYIPVANILSTWS